MGYIGGPKCIDITYYYYLLLIGYRHKSNFYQLLYTVCENPKKEYVMSSYGCRS